MVKRTLVWTQQQAVVGGDNVWWYVISSDQVWSYVHARGNQMWWYATARRDSGPTGCDLLSGYLEERSLTWLQRPIVKGRHHHGLKNSVYNVMILGSGLLECQSNWLHPREWGRHCIRGATLTFLVMYTSLCLNLLFYVLVRVNGVNDLYIYRTECTSNIYDAYKQIKMPHSSMHSTRVKWDVMITHS